jgi:exopolyphosphatase/guanosine-5'-triphosphate,3'-diphosphate pyrophosphatase
MRIATIDIGTNSVLLLIVEPQTHGLASVHERATITRLGQGVDANGVLAPEAVERTLACLRDYAATIADADVERVGAVATSAMRDARGGDAFLDAAESLLGVRPEVISGEREAALTFEGALSGLDIVGDVAVFDVGGGSTEIVLGTVGDSGSILASAVSLDVGAVRLTERHLKSDPPSEEQLQAVRRDVRGALQASPALRGRPLVGVAGTVTTLAALAHQVAPYDGERVHGAGVSAAQLDELVRLLAGKPLDERRQLAALDPRRADVIVAGAIVVQEVARHADAAAITASDRGVRWGLAKNLAGQATAI